VPFEPLEAFHPVPTERPPCWSLCSNSQTKIAENSKKVKESSIDEMAPKGARHMLQGLVFVILAIFAVNGLLRIR